MIHLFDGTILKVQNYIELTLKLKLSKLKLSKLTLTVHWGAVIAVLKNKLKLKLPIDFIDEMGAFQIH